MNIVVIDGQGGGLGRQLVVELRAKLPKAYILAVGTNSAATFAMLKGGADSGATGENSVLVACRRADIITGPIGIVVADALLGEITPAMAAAVGQSNAKRVLLPVSHCDTVVAGISAVPMGKLVAEAARLIMDLTK